MSFPHSNGRNCPFKTSTFGRVSVWLALRREEVSSSGKSLQPYSLAAMSMATLPGRSEPLFPLPHRAPYHPHARKFLREWVLLSFAQGGGVAMYGSIVTFTNCNVSGNDAFYVSPLHIPFLCMSSIAAAFASFLGFPRAARSTFV